MALVHFAAHPNTVTSSAAPPVCCSLPCRAVLPIGVLFGITLWLGNAAYLHLSVSFVQMLKVSTADPAE